MDAIFDLPDLSLADLHAKLEEETYLQDNKGDAHQAKPEDLVMDRFLLEEPTGNANMPHSLQDEGFDHLVDNNLVVEKILNTLNDDHSNIFGGVDLQSLLSSVSEVTQNQQKNVEEAEQEALEEEVVEPSPHAMEVEEQPEEPENDQEMLQPSETDVWEAPLEPPGEAYEEPIMMDEMPAEEKNVEDKQPLEQQELPVHHDDSYHDTGLFEPAEPEGDAVDAEKKHLPSRQKKSCCG